MSSLSEEKLIKSYLLLNININQHLFKYLRNQNTLNKLVVWTGSGIQLDIISLDVPVQNGITTHLFPYSQ